MSIWPPSEEQLNSDLASIVEVLWSASTANYIRAGKLSVEEIKAKYALRDVLLRYAAAGGDAIREAERRGMLRAAGIAEEYSDFIAAATIRTEAETPKGVE